eukprot:PLAT4997.7.p1 GENE.PLAT4997.7~~PLAT4997.7.p1  ORF type:complete len:625 (-),score=185.80 PLAT4997.7:119-1993(-)
MASEGHGAAGKSPKSGKPRLTPLMSPMRRSESSSTLGGPSFSFGGAGVSRSSSPKPSDAPGPGAYGALPSPPSSPAARWGSAPRDSGSVYGGTEALTSLRATSSESVGPGAYILPSSLSTKGGVFGRYGESFSSSSERKTGSSAAVTPGPGEYGLADYRPASPTPSFAGASREQMRRVYSGSGTGIMAVDSPGPIYSPTVTRTGEPALGSRPKTPSWTPAKRKLPRPATSGGQAMAALRALREAAKRPHTSPEKGGAEKTKRKGSRGGSGGADYSWLHRHHTTKSTYKLARDGADMLRSREFPSAGTASFGTGRRFHNKVYTPQGDNGATDSPGPVYDVPSTIATKPSYSWRPPSRSRSELTRVESPGPGSYYRDTSKLMERERLLAIMSKKRVDAARKKVKRPTPSWKRRTRGGKVKQPKMKRRPMTGLRYGLHPDKAAVPTVSFAGSSRDKEQKRYQPGKLGEPMRGRDSPGPSYVSDISAVKAKSPAFSFGGAGVERNKVIPATSSQASLLPAKTDEESEGEEADDAALSDTSASPKKAMKKTNKKKKKKKPRRLRKSKSRGTFGTSSRDAASRLFCGTLLSTPAGARESPGPAHYRGSDRGSRMLGHSRSAPAFRFGTAK